MTKEIVATAIENLPDKFDLDELIERLIFIEKVEEGIREIEDGKGIPLEEVKQIVKGWRK
jgi:hypothetical protein